MKCRCKRCGHEWIARVKKPKVCTKCKSYEWNKEKNQGRKEGKK